MEVKKWSTLECVHRLPLSLLRLLIWLLAFLRFHALYLFNVVWYLHTAQVRPGCDSQAKPSDYEALRKLVKYFET